jgi:hypothetical protein
MGMRNWAVGVASAAAVVAGVVVVQSGISGSALPILPHRSAVSAADDGADLPAPAEVNAAPPPAAGAVRQVASTRAAAAVPHPPAPAGPEAGHRVATPPPAEKEHKDHEGEDGGKDSGKDGKSGSGKERKFGGD